MRKASFLVFCEKYTANFTTNFNFNIIAKLQFARIKEIIDVA